MAPRLSPSSRTSAVTIPRQLAPAVGPAHGGFEFLKGSFEGLKGYAVGRMTKSRRGKLYIDDTGVRRPSTLMMSRPLVRRIRYTNCKMAGLGAVPMAVVFRTPLSRRAE